MTVFSGFLKSLKKSFWVVLIYVSIFVLLTFASLSTFSKKAADQFSVSRPEVLLAATDGIQEFDTALRTQIESFGTLHVKQVSVEEARDLVVGQAYDIAVFVHPDAENRLKTGGTPVVELYYEDANPAGVLAAMNLNRYVMYLDAFYKLHQNMDYSKVLESSTQDTKVELLNNDKAMTKTLFFRFYIKFFHYVFISLALFVVAPNLMMMNFGYLKARRGVSSLRPTGCFLQISLAIFVVVMGFLAFFFVLGLGVVGFDVDYSTVLLLALDLFVFSIALVAFTVFLSSLPIGNNTISTIANVASIVVAFTSGIFVPSELLPQAITNLAKAFPAYYSVQVVATENLETNQILYYFGIQLLFAFVFGLAAIYTSKSRRTESIKMKNAPQ